MNATVAGAGTRPAHLRLVSDHGRMTDPDFTPVCPVWVAGVSVPHAGRRNGGRGNRGRRRAVRLTRRGRFLITCTVVVLAALASMALAV